MPKVARTLSPDHPTASATCPTRGGASSANFAASSPKPSTLSTARSLAGSRPTNRASSVRRSPTAASGRSPALPSTHSAPPCQPSRRRARSTPSSLAFAFHDHLLNSCLLVLYPQAHNRPSPVRLVLAQ